MSPRGTRLSAIAGAFIVLLVVSAIGLNRGLRAAQSRIHATVEQRLRAYFGEVRVGDASLGWAGDVVIGPIEVAAHSSGAPPVFRCERVILRPRLVAVLLGRAEIRSVRLEGVSVHAGSNGDELRALWERIQRRRPFSQNGSTGVAGTVPAIEFSDLRLAAALSGRELTLGPLWGSVEIGGGATRKTTGPLFAEEGRVELAVVRMEDRTELSAEFGGVDLAPLAAAISTPVALQKGRIRGRIHLAASGSSGFEADAELEAQEIFLVGERLSDGPVGPLRIRWDGPVRWNPEDRQFSVGPGRVALGERHEAAFHIDARLSEGGIESAFRIHVEPEQLSYARLVSALPEVLRPPPAMRSVDGPLLGSFEIQGPLHHRAAWELQAHIDLKPLREVLGSSDPLGMRDDFRHRVTLANGTVREIRVGAGSAHFVPLADMPEVLVRAVLLSEDSAFFTHSGFDLPALWQNLTRGADARGVLRGGSTISQQLVKNLFFGREKTYVRKFREALATVALEASVPKNRILEIYLNLIEWGPGIYGIGEAAAHYFGKEPHALSVREAVFLATIIPNPIKYHGYCSRGALTELWEQRMRELLEKMHSAGALTDDQLEQGMSAPLAFLHGRTN